MTDNYNPKPTVDFNEWFVREILEGRLLANQPQVFDTNIRETMRRLQRACARMGDAMSMELIVKLGVFMLGPARMEELRKLSVLYEQGASRERNALYGSTIRNSG